MTSLDRKHADGLETNTINSFASSCSGILAAEVNRLPRAITNNEESFIECSSVFDKEAHVHSLDDTQAFSRIRPFISSSKTEKHALTH